MRRINAVRGNIVDIYQDVTLGSDFRENVTFTEWQASSTSR